MGGDAPGALIGRQKTFEKPTSGDLSVFNERLGDFASIHIRVNTVTPFALGPVTTKWTRRESSSCTNSRSPCRSYRSCEVAAPACAIREEARRHGGRNKCKPTALGSILRPNRGSACRSDRRHQHGDLCSVKSEALVGYRSPLLGLESPCV
jgi:hypothetical protein